MTREELKERITNELDNAVFMRKTELFNNDVESIGDLSDLCCELHMVCYPYADEDDVIKYYCHNIYNEALTLFGKQDDFYKRYFRLVKERMFDDLEASSDIKDFTGFLAYNICDYNSSIMISKTIDDVQGALLYSDMGIVDYLYVVKQISERYGVPWFYDTLMLLGRIWQIDKSFSGYGWKGCIPGNTMRFFSVNHLFHIFEIWD